MNETTIDRVDRALFTLMVPAGMVGVISVRTLGEEIHAMTVWFEFPKAPPPELVHASIEGVGVAIPRMLPALVH